MATWSGVGRYTTGLARALAARDDVQLIQVCGQGERPPVPHGPHAEIVSATAHPFGVRGALELGRIAHRMEPGLVHCLHFPTPVPVRAPLVVTLHDLTPLLVPGVMPSTAKRLAYRRWNARAVSTASAILVPSRSTERDVANLFRSVQHKLTVIPEAADDFASGSPTTLTGALARLASPPYLLSMGNTKPHKDLPTLLRAFERLAPSRPELHLLLTGVEPPGYLGTALANASPEVRSRVTFTGRVSDGELRTIYAGAAAFVFPSTYEGFGLPVLEAMALGAPVVCADAASLPEVADDAALLFPAGDPWALERELARVFDDPTVRARLIDDGRRRAARFTWKQTASDTVDAYFRLLSPSGVRQE